jgi:hypothetical protein
MKAEYKVHESNRRKTFQYENADEVIADPQEHFRVNCFNQILDTAVFSIYSRTQQLKYTYELCGFLYHAFSRFNPRTNDEVLKKTWRWR